MAQTIASLIVLIGSLTTPCSCFSWTGGPPPNASLLECLGNNVSLDWDFLTSTEDTVLSILWFFTNATHTDPKHVATATSGSFLQSPGTKTRMEFLPKAGLRLYNFSTQDLGTYTVHINLFHKWNFISQHRSVTIALTESPIMSSGRLRAWVVSGTITVRRSSHVRLACGTIINHQHAKFSISWTTPSGQSLPSTSHADGVFYLTLDNPVAGGPYSCQLQGITALSCLGNGSQTTMAVVDVDALGARMLALEDSTRRHDRDLELQERVVDVVSQSINNITVNLQVVDGLTEKTSKRVDNLCTHVQVTANVTTETAQSMDRLTRNVEDQREAQSRMMENLNGVMEELTNQSGRVTNLALSVDYLKSDTEKVDKSVDSLTTDMKTLSGSVDSFTSDTEKLSRSVGSLKSDAETLNRSLDSLTSGTKTLSGSVDSLTTATKTLNVSVDNLKSDTKNMSGVIDSLKVDMETLNSSLNSLTSDIKSLSGSVDSLTTDTLSESVDSLKSDTKKLNESVASLKLDTKTLNRSLDSLTSDTETLSGSLASLTSDTKTLNISLDSLTSELLATVNVQRKQIEAMTSQGEKQHADIVLLLQEANNLTALAERQQEELTQQKQTITKLSTLINTQSGNMAQQSKTITSLTSNLASVMGYTSSTFYKDRQVRPPSCLEVKKYNATSSVHDIYVSGRDVRVYCDQGTAGGGWTVIQRRQDGSVDFYRGWQEYLNGFGSAGGEYWLGLDNIYYMTRSARYTLRVDLTAFDGTTAYAEYSQFYIDGADKNYTLHVSGHSGSAGDSLAYHNNMPFSTHDHGSYCPPYFKGAWWYYDCHRSHLNGRYKTSAVKGYDGIIWMDWKKDASLKKAEMKLRPVV